MSQKSLPNVTRLQWITDSKMEDYFLSSAEIMHNSFASHCRNWTTGRSSMLLVEQPDSFTGNIFWTHIIFIFFFACLPVWLQPHENPNTLPQFWFELGWAEEVLWGSPAGCQKNVLWIQKSCQLHLNTRREPRARLTRLKLHINTEAQTEQHLCSSEAPCQHVSCKK